MDTRDIIASYFGRNIKNLMINLDGKIISNAQEIRIRANKPLSIKSNSNEYFINSKGITTDYTNAYMSTFEDISQMIELMSNYSIYAFSEELKQGYITLPGGFRVGITGKTVIENKCVKTIKNISGINIRISHEIKGCGLKVIDYIAIPSIKHTLIISPPNCGKTTLLRDIIRIISDGINNKLKGMTIGVADERSEIAGSYMGLAQNDVGIRTDILDGCPKAEAMIMLLRSMSPNVIAVDEIGNEEDIHAIHNIINSGIKIICTVHGHAIEDIRNKPVLCELINKDIFERYVVLSHKKGAGTIEAIYDNNFENIYKEVIL